MKTYTFATWRRARQLPSKQPMGQKPRITELQQELLDYLEEHPWRKVFTIKSELASHRWSIEERLVRLMDKGLVDVAVHGRIKHYALAGTTVPEGFMRLMRGARGLFHYQLADRIADVLRKEPWMTMPMIQRRLPLSKAKAVEQSLLNGFRDRRFVRRLVQSPARSMYAYSIPKTRLMASRRSKILDETMKETNNGKARAEVLAFLRRRPWSTIRDFQVEVKRSFLHNVLAALIEDGEVQRVRIAEIPLPGRGRSPMFAWALATEISPCPHPKMPERVEGASDLVLAKVAEIVRRSSWSTTIQIHQEYVRQHRKASYSRICAVLKRLEILGVVTRATRGRAAHRWAANGQVDPLRWMIANANFLQLSRSARALRELDYRVDVELRPPPIDPRSANP